MSCHFEPTIYETFIDLIFKVDPLITFKDLRLISLCNIIYKIITKVLLNCLCTLRDTIFWPHQSSFLRGRGTIDMLLFCKKTFTLCGRPRRRRVMSHLIWRKHLTCKLGLLKVLSYSCFLHLITIKLLTHYVASFSISVLWNGNNNN